MWELQVSEYGKVRVFTGDHYLDMRNEMLFQLDQFLGGKFIQQEESTLDVRITRSAITGYVDDGESRKVVFTATIFQTQKLPDLEDDEFVLVLIDEGKSGIPSGAMLFRSWRDAIANVTATIPDDEHKSLVQSTLVALAQESPFPEIGEVFDGDGFRVRTASLIPPGYQIIVERPGPVSFNTCRLVRIRVEGGE